jgi:GT2 family glycosyltransferase
MNAKNCLSVSIVLYKTPLGQLERCLASLMKVQPLPSLYVVDNSPDDSLAVVQDLYPGAHYTHMPTNPGFGAGHNIAIKQSQREGYRFHLVLNADVYFEGDVLSPMISYMDQHADVGQMMPKVLNPDGSVQRLCKLVPTPSDLFLRRFSRPETRVRRNRTFELHDSGYDKIMFVPYLSGCFMLLRQSALREIGAFDERFFMYPEDIDLTRRMAERYETLFFPEVSVFHEHGAASRKSMRMLWIHMYNLVKYFNKWGWVVDPMRTMLNEKTLSRLRAG